MLNHEIIRSAETALCNRAWAIRQAEFGREIEHDFTAEQIRSRIAAQDLNPWLEEALGDQITHPALYLLSAGNVEIAEALKHSFDSLPDKRERGYALPKRNKVRPGQTILYVGSSKNIKSRLKQHIGQAPVGTYALNLQRWCPEFEGIVTVKVLLFSPVVGWQCRQDIEDAVWDFRQPIFGKKGPR